MDRKLRDVLTRLAAGRDPAALADTDWAAIDAALGNRVEADPSAPRPLWAHVREQALRWKQVFELPIDWIGSDTDAVFIDAGVPASYRLDGGIARRAAPVRRDALVKSVTKHLTHEYPSVRALAAMLVGLAKLDEVVPVMVEALTSGREERNSWGAAQVIGPMLESLAMLDHPQARELAAKWTSHSDDRLRRAAQVCTLLAAAQISDGELARALDGGVHNHVVLSFPDVMVRLGASSTEQGLILAQRLAQVEQNSYRYSDGTILASIARRAKLVDFHRHLLGANNYELKHAAIQELIGTGATECLDAARAQLAQESDDQAQAALICAISTLLPDDAARRAWIEEKLAGSTGERTGACYAALLVPGLTERLRPLLADSEEDVRRAAATALLVHSDDCSTELLEVRLLELSRNWRGFNYKLAGKMLGLTRHGAPWVAIDSVLLTDQLAPCARDAFDAIVAFYRANPERLIRRLSPEVTNQEQVRVRAAHLAGHLGGEILEAAIEARLSACDSWTECVELCLEATCAGGPRTPVGKTAAKLLLHEQTTPVELDADDLLPAVILASRQDSMIRSRAAGALYQLPEAAPYLGGLAQLGNDTSLGKAVGQALAQMSGAADKLVCELADLMAGRTKKLTDLSLLPVVANAGAYEIRAKLAEAATHPDNAWDDVARFMVTLAGDGNQDVAIAALTALARRAGGERWVQAMLLEKSRSDDWSVSRQTIDIMGGSGHAAFVPRLVEMLNKALVDSDQDRGNRCVAALEQIADANPDRGLVVFDVREPYALNTKFGMQENVDYNADRKTEALRLLLLGLDKRKNAEAAKAAKGKTILFTASHAAVGPARPLGGTELEGLVLYLRVTFSDADSGDIVAEVGDEPTGELINALLQSHAVSVTHATWS